MYEKDKLAQGIVRIKRMRIHLFCNLKPKADLGEISSKNLLEDGLIRPVYEFIKSVTKNNSKVREPKTYNEVINNHINGNRWHKTINEE